MNKKVIKNKIKSTQNIKKITKTMEMVSVAKMRKAVTQAEGYKTFGIEAKNILAKLSDQREKHIFSESPNAEKTLIIIIAGQKGLCGGYNSNIFRAINKLYREEIKNHKLKFITIGKYADKIARRYDDKNAINADGKNIENKNILLSFNQKDWTNKDARVIVKKIEEEFLNKNFKNIDIVYTDFENINTQIVTKETLLPFDSKNIKELKDLDDYPNSKYDDLEYTFEPNVAQVYEYTIRILLQNIITGSILRARAAEHAARMMAMKTATDNAGEMIDELKLWYNKARQAAITQEIAEISSAAISGK